MQIKNEIWILADNRPGTFSQSIGLAEEIGLKYKIITLSYNFFSHLPNFFLKNQSLQVSTKLKKQIETSDYLPKIIISAGRRSAPSSLYLKSKSSDRSKIIQIMNPNLDFAKFDFVILPKHDEIAEEKFPNLITAIGALTRVDEKRLQDEVEKFPEIKNITKTKIALLIGGAGKKTKFSENDVKALTRIASQVAKNMDATLVVLTSHRTGSSLTNAIKQNLECDFKIFDWSMLNGANPYLATLANSDFFIVTGDSVSMISECASTGKPLYIFDQQRISSEKHRRFHQNLFAENYAKKFSSDLKILENFSPKKLQETKRIAAIIKNKIA